MTTTTAAPTAVKVPIRATATTPSAKKRFMGALATVRAKAARSGAWIARLTAPVWQRIPTGAIATGAAATLSTPKTIRWSVNTVRRGSNWVGRGLAAGARWAVRGLWWAGTTASYLVSLVSQRAGDAMQSFTDDSTGWMLDRIDGIQRFGLADRVAYVMTQPRAVRVMQSVAPLFAIVGIDRLSGGAISAFTLKHTGKAITATNGELARSAAGTALAAGVVGTLQARKVAEPAKVVEATEHATEPTTAPEEQAHEVVTDTASVEDGMMVVEVSGAETPMEARKAALAHRDQVQADAEAQEQARLEAEAAQAGVVVGGSAKARRRAEQSRRDRERAASGR